MAAGCTEYSLHEELELLEAIYIHELTVEGNPERPNSLSVLLHPSTGNEEHKQYVCLTLVIILTDKYPASCPSLSIRSPRGLSDAHISSILSNLRELAESRLGGPMLYELIEYAKESLTDNNIPSCACTICLNHFQDSDSFTRTDCYHYFHCCCLLRFIEFSLQAKDTQDEDSKEVECPVCRLPVTYDLNSLGESSAAEPGSEENHYEADEAMKKLQKKMASLYEKQLQKGGIIDVELERRRFLIDTSSANSASRSNSDQSTSETPTHESGPAEALGEPVKPVKQGKREPQGHGKGGGSGNKHKRAGRKPATGGTRSEGSGKREVMAPDVRSSQGRENGKRDERILVQNSSATALKDRDVGENKSSRKGDLTADQRANSKAVQEKRGMESTDRNQSAQVKVQGPGDQRNASDAWSAERPEPSKPRNQAGRPGSAARANTGSEATNQKTRRPPPGFERLPGDSRTVKPPPGFERSANGSGGCNSKKSAVRDKSYRLKTQENAES